MGLPIKEHGFLIKSSGGDVYDRPTRGSGGWSLYKTRRNAEKRADRIIGASVIEVILTIEEKL